MEPEHAKSSKRRNPEDVKTAVILKGDRYEPDFFAIEVFKGHVFPWKESSPYYEDCLEEMSRLGLV